MTKILVVAVSLFLLLPVVCVADCVWFSSPDRWIYVDSNTLILCDLGKPRALIKIWGRLFSTSSVSILKHEFCSHDSAVLLIDGEPVDVREVRRLN